MKIKQRHFSSYAREILANNITYFRLKRNWSQEEFAEKLGTTAVYISNLENARRNVRIDYIGKIAETFKIPLEELFVKREKVSNHRIPKQ